MNKNFGKILVILWTISLLLSACVPTDAARIKSLAGGVADALPANWPEGSPVEAIARQRPEPSEMADVQILKVGLSSLPSLDSVLNYSTASLLHNVLYIGLTRQYPDTLEFLPALAEKWQVSEDQLTWTFTLRANIPWVAYNSKTQELEKVADKDGKTLFVTAEDVRSNILRVLAMENNAWQKKLLINIQGAEDYSLSSPKNQPIGIEAKDDLTLVFTLTQPIPAFDAIAELPFFSPYSGRVDELRDKEELTGMFLGTFGYGPFIIKSYVANKTAVLVRNPFWQPIDAVLAPLLSEIQFSVIVSNNKLSSFNKGTIDIVQLTQNEYKTQKASLEQQKTLHIVDGNCPMYLAFRNVDEKPLSDIKNRLALAYAVDKTAIIEQVYGGAAKEMGSFANSALRAGGDFDAIFPRFYDPVQAKKYADTASTSVSKIPFYIYRGYSTDIYSTTGEMILNQVNDILDWRLSPFYPNIANYNASIIATEVPIVYSSTFCYQYSDAEAVWQQVVNALAAEYPEITVLHRQVRDQKTINDRAAVYLQLNEALVDEQALVIPLILPSNIWLVQDKVIGDLRPLYQQFETWWIAK